MVKNLPAMWETQGRYLGWGDRLEKRKATHSSILSWRIWLIEDPMGYSDPQGVTKSQTWLSDWTAIKGMLDFASRGRWCAPLGNSLGRALSFLSLLAYCTEKLSHISRPWSPYHMPEQLCSDLPSPSGKWCITSSPSPPPPMVGSFHRPVPACTQTTYWAAWQAVLL